MAIKTIKEVCIGSDVEAYEYIGEDGYPIGQSFSPVCVTTIDNCCYYLPIGQRKRDEEGFVYYTERYNSDVVFTRVYRRRYIETEKWAELENRSLEDKFDSYAEEEYYDRVNYGGYRNF